MPVIVHLVKSRNLRGQIRYQAPLQRRRRSFGKTSFAKGTKADCRAYLEQQRVQHRRVGFSGSWQTLPPLRFPVNQRGQPLAVHCLGSI
jgi:hypothetical protein